MRLFGTSTLAFALIFTTLTLVSFTQIKAQANDDVQAIDTLQVESPWTLGGLVSVTGSWTGFWNWAQGGEKTTSIVGIANGSAVYKKGKHDWVSIIDMAYGIARVGEEPWRKNDDRIDLLSQYGYNLGGNFDLSGRMNFRTQFAPGYNLPDDSTVASRFMSPGYLMLSTGITWRAQPWLTVLVHPVAGKFTFVLDQDIANTGAYGVEPAVFDTSTGALIREGERIRAEFGALASVLVRKKWEKITLQSRADFFHNYTPEEGTSRSIDVTWETIFSYQLFKWLTLNFTSTLLYDQDVKTPIFAEQNGEEVQVGEEARVQYRQVIGVGLGYTFGKRAERPAGANDLPFNNGG